MTIAAVIAVLLAAIAIGWTWNSARTGRSPDDVAAKAREDAGKAADDPGAEWQAKVDLEHIGEKGSRYQVSRLSIVLRDARGKELETPDTSFEVNGARLVYRVGQGNYYDRHPYYQLDDDAKFVVAADTTYDIAVLRNKDPALPFARIRTPAPMLPANFQVPVRQPANRDLVIQWTGLRQQAELLIYKTHTLIDAQGNQTIEAGGPYADDAIRKIIGPDEHVLREGRHVIPASYFVASAAGRVSSLTIEVDATNSGQFLHPVLKRSTITARRKIVFRIDVMEPQDQ
jgi:hypothetical protein